jgi:hypothetical protein
MRYALAALVGVAVIAIALSLDVGCGNGGGGGGEVCSAPGRRCATPSCATSLDTPGCDDVAPVNGRCPLERSHCFDPTLSPQYCNPAVARCAKWKSPLPMDCSDDRCTVDALSACFDFDTSGLVCHYGFTCTPFGCADGGVDGSTDGGGGDGATDGGRD